MIAPPTTSIDPITGGVLIQWVAPFSNAEPITQYNVAIVNSAGVAVTESIHCNGADPFVVSNLRCVVPMSKLLSDFSLQYPNLVRVQVSAFNFYGWGPVSALNT